jgi:dihydrofolate synthase/folylpolyglutamate synthase
LPDGRTVILDGAHNPAGVAAVADFVGELARPPDLLFGALADKDAAGMLPALAPRVGRITLTAPPSPRALDPRDLALVVAEREVALEPDPECALDRALATTSGTLLVCGSLYLVGDLRAALRRRFGVPPPAADL